jgi:F0F1-type ATP synthase assembly protein I
MTEEKFTNQNNQLERERERERQNLAKIEEFTKKHKEWENANSAANTFGFSLGLIIGLLILVTI